MTHRVRRLPVRLVCALAAAGALAVFIGLLGWRSVHAQGPTIVFLGDHNLPPYEFLDDGVARGANVELLQALGRALDRPVEIRLMNWSEAQAKVRAGEADALTLMAATVERERIYAFSEPTFSGGHSFFVRTRDFERFEKNAEGLRTVAVLAGGFPESYLRTHWPQLSLVVVPNLAEGMRLLLRGNVDAMAALTWTGRDILADLGISTVRPLTRPFAEQSPGIAVLHENAALLDDINAALRRLKADGTFDRIVERWAGRRLLFISERDVVVAIGAAVVAAFALLLIVGLLLMSQSRRRALAREIGERQRIEAELRESEARFRNMADNAPVMIWVTGVDGACTFLSRSWYDFTGLAPDDGLGFGWLAPVHADDRERVHVTFLAAAARREGFRLDYRLQRVDGAWRWVIDAAAPRLAEDGAFLGYIGSVIDISERKQAEERQTLLMREVNHRAKNALAVVQAVVRLTRADNMTAFADVIEGRVTALARAHSLLAAGDWTGASLRRLVEAELAPYPGTSGRAVISGPEVIIAPAAVQSVAMIVHELATNAVKYGALSVPGGRVTVRWQVVAERELLLSWREQGGPEVVEPPRPGFGTTLIERCVGDQLGGRARIDWQGGGLGVDLALPLRHVEGDAATAGGGDRPVDGDAGSAVLLVEDEALVALDLEAAVRNLGYRVLGPVACEDEALALLERATPRAAVLDLNLAGRTIAPLALRLVEKGVPIVFCSGYSDLQALPGSLQGAPLLGKPIDRAALAEVLGRLLPEERSPSADVAHRPPAA